MSWYLKKRINNIERFMLRPADVQEEVLLTLIQKAQDTEWGRAHNYSSISTSEQFKREVPVGNYESHQPWIERVMKGEQNLLWPSEIKWFAKSSGTTSAKSKFIPVTYESLDECHFQGGKDAMLMYFNNNPDSTVFDGKGLILGGSHQLNKFSSESYYGDLSAVMMQNMPFWAQFFRTPDLNIAIMENWDDKLEKMANATIHDDVTSISGVPTWTLMLAERVLELTGKRTLKEVWPNLELYVHGGVSFTPYRQRFSQVIGSEGMHYLETYNASEGFIGIQDDLNSENMLLMLDYGIYYEFMPMSEYGKTHPKTYSIDEVKLNEQYALIISTNAGLWRYIIGDTIRFTSINPFRFKISGRTKHYINAFGEELIIENADHAIQETCRRLNIHITDYTAAPVFHHDKSVGTHEWLIEFVDCTLDEDTIIDVLDEELKKCNSDYEAKRYNNIAMTKPLLHKLPKNTFNRWLRQKDKLGGQHKVPRLYNDRTYVDEILLMTHQKNRAYEAY
ncbi:MAG: GH3 auxin-responsive promoter family protein [Bacteroidota bacterium]